jgi:hypothetical protein
MGTLELRCPPESPLNFSPGVSLGGCLFHSTVFALILDTRVFFSTLSGYILKSQYKTDSYTVSILE